MTLTAAVCLQNIIKEKCGYLLPIVSDTKSATEYEILIGKTNRVESDQVYTEVIKNDKYQTALKLINQKLVLAFGGGAVGLDVVEEIESYLDMNSTKEVQLDSLFKTISRSSKYAVTGDYRIMSFNVLNGEPYNRDELAKGIIEAYIPDIFGLQEYNNTYRELGSFALLKDYKELTIPGVDPINIWTPLFYRYDKFDVLAYGHKEYDTKTTHNHSYGKSKFQSVTWALFSDKANGKVFYIFNTHFDTNADNRAVQADELLQIITEQKKKFDAPIFVTGDLNGSLTDKGVAKILSSGFLNTSSLAKTTNNIPGMHYAAELDAQHGIYAIYHRGDKYPSRIDHIFTNTHNIEIHKFMTINNLSALIASDHCPIYIDFDLK